MQPANDCVPPYTIFYKLHRTGGESLQPPFGLKKGARFDNKKVRVWAIVFSIKKVRDLAKKVRDGAPAYLTPFGITLNSIKFEKVDKGHTDG